MNRVLCTRSLESLNLSLNPLPQDVAQAIIDALPPAAAAIITDMSVAGAGFINMRVQEGYIIDRLRWVILRRGRGGIASPSGSCRFYDLGRIILSLDLVTILITHTPHHGHQPIIINAPRVTRG
jgi:hypothetical protein